MRRIGYALLMFVMFGGVLSLGSPVAQAAPRPTTATTTDVLNLRSGPSLSGTVVTVIPMGAQVTLTGKEQRGFRSVSYSGRSGWAFSAYLAIDDAPASPHARAMTTDALNLRAGPGASHPVMVVMPRSTRVTFTGETTNGYRAVVFGAYRGWASGEYLTGGATSSTPTPAPGGTAVTTDVLNLRAGAGVSHAVVSTMPARSRVVLTGQISGGFHAVSFNGRTGWASAAYLAIEGTTSPPTRSATTTDALNLRSGPATSYGVLAVIPRGGSVTLTGQVSNGFHGVSYGGKTGWAFSAYLNPEPSSAAPRLPFATTNSIIGPTRGSASQAIGYARRAGAVRMDEVERYIREIYRLAPQVGFDPALLVSQSALETGNWRSKWWKERLNPSGLGITGSKGQNNASQKFPSGTIAARAQIAHMHAEVYGTSRPFPHVLQGVDVSYQNVYDAGWAGTIRTLEDLSGTWAADPKYHTKVVRVAREIFG